MHVGWGVVRSADDTPTNRSDSMTFALHMKTAQRRVVWPDLPETDRSEMEDLVQAFQDGCRPMQLPLRILGPTTTFGVRWCDVRDVWIEDKENDAIR